MKNYKRINKFKKKRGLALDRGVFLSILLLLGLFLILLLTYASAAPESPSDVNITANETKGAGAAQSVNVSGGYITTINITASVQNPRWKGMVGHVLGTFTLDDSTGSTLYDWSITSIAGEVYATNNASTVIWTQIKCATINVTKLESQRMGHTSSDDNITYTFNNGVNGSHAEFFVGAVNISQNSCPTLNTYIDNATQDASFEEIVLYDGLNYTDIGAVVFAAIIENDVVGFDSLAYDFQMIVPERGEQGFADSTAYYLYVELS